MSSEKGAKRIAPTCAKRVEAMRASPSRIARSFGFEERMGSGGRCSLFPVY
jgi:hypothetical protein